MLPEISIGPLTLQTFGLMSVFGCWFGGWLLARRFRELGYPVEWAWELVVLTIIFGVLGATADWTIQNGASLVDVPELIMSGGGMIWYGGLTAVIAVFLIWTWLRKMPFWDVFSSVVYGFVSVQLFGRLGCQLSGDGDYGVPWSGPWAMSYENGTVPTPPGVTVHPTPIYESIGLAFLLFLLWKLRWRVSQPALFAIWMIGAGIIRFLVEFIRRNTDTLLRLTTAQLFSLILISAGIVLLAFSYKKVPPLPISKRQQRPDVRFFPWEKKDQKAYNA